MPHQQELREPGKLTSRSFAERLDAPTNLALPGFHLGLSWRRLTIDDLAAVVELMRATSSGAVDHVCETSVRNWLERTQVDVDHYDNLSGWDTQGELQVVASVRVSENPLTELQADLDAVTRPTWVGRGIGRIVLEWQDGRARQLLLNFEHDLPVSIRATVEAKNLERRRLLAAGGFAPVGRLTYVVTRPKELHRDVSSQAETRLEARGMSLRNFDPAVSDELMRLHNRLSMSMERYQPLSESMWQEKLNRTDTGLSFLLTKEDSLIGYVLTERTSGGESLRVYYFGVERNLRRQGIGTDLILSILGPAFDAGMHEVEVPIVSEDVPPFQYLSKHGFLEGSSEIMYAIDI